MNWIAFQTATGGLGVAGVRNAVASHDKQRAVKPATAVHGGRSFQYIGDKRAAALATQAGDGEPVRADR